MAEFAAFESITYDNFLPIEGMIVSINIIKKNLRTVTTYESLK
jgi:hypothetical protein